MSIVNPQTELLKIPTVVVLYCLFLMSVTVTFHFMFDRIIFFRFGLLSGYLFRKELLTRLTVCSLLLFWLFPVLFRGRDFGSDCSGSWSLLICYFYNEEDGVSAFSQTFLIQSL